MATITLLVGDSAKAAQAHAEIVEGRDDILIPAFVAWGAPPQRDLLPMGIAAYADSALETVIISSGAREAMLCLHGVTYPALRALARRIESAGATWVLPGMRQLMRRVPQPVVAVSGLGPAANTARAAEAVAAALASAGMPAGIVTQGKPAAEPAAGAATEEPRVLVIDAGADTPWVEPDLWIVASAAGTAVGDWFYPGKDAAESCDAFLSLSDDRTATLASGLTARNPAAPVLCIAALDGPALGADLRARARARGKHA